MDKTLIIYSGYSALPLFTIVDGDYSHLNDVVCGEAADDPEYEDNQSQLLELLFDENNKHRHTMLRDFPLDQPFNKVANVGCT